MAFQKFNITSKILHSIRPKSSLILTNGTSCIFYRNMGTLVLYTKAKFPFITSLLTRFSLFIQTSYDFIILKILNTKLKPILLFWFKCLIYFRHLCDITYIAIGNQYFFSFIFLLALICSRLHIAGMLILCFMLILRIEFAFLRMAKFYRNNPSLLVLHFPDWQNPKRGMHKVVVNAILEASQNPMIQGIAVGIGGAIVWKALDVHDTNNAHQTTLVETQSNEKMAREEIVSNEKMAREEIVANEKMAREEIVSNEKISREEIISNEKISREEIAVAREANEIARLALKNKED